MKYLFTAIIGLSLLSCQNTTDDKPIHSDSKDHITSEHLISVAEADSILKAAPDNSILIQVTPLDKFNNGHIPGAYQIWRPDYGSTDSQGNSGMIAIPDQLNALLSSVCYKSEKTLLVYDNKGNVDALRFCWILELYGISNYKIINGGLKSWSSAGFPISKSQSQSCESLESDFVSSIDSTSYATYDEVLQSINNNDYLLVDTREDYEFKAEPFIKDGEIFAYKKGAFERGKIPGSIHLNWSELVDLNGDHRIKSQKDLEYDLQRKGITRDKNIIVYCQSGSRSAHTYYVLKHILHFPNVKNYDGSWIEWSNNYVNNKGNTIEQNCSQDSFDVLYKKLESQLNI